MLWGCLQDNKIVHLSVITRLGLHPAIGTIEFTISLCHFQDQLQINLRVSGIFLWCKVNQEEGRHTFLVSTEFSAALEMKHA